MPSYERDITVCMIEVITQSGKPMEYDNFITEKNQSFEYVAKKMIPRIQKMFKINQFVEMRVYDWQNQLLKQTIEGIYYNNRICTKENALVKVWIGMPSGINNETYYNFERELNLQVNEICNRMYKRLVVEKFKFKFTTAKFYTRNNVNEEFTEIKQFSGKFITQYNAVG